jgi:hypothetical protein
MRGISDEQTAVLCSQDFANKEDLKKNLDSKKEYKSNLKSYINNLKAVVRKNNRKYHRQEIFHNSPGSKGGYDFSAGVGYYLGSGAKGDVGVIKELEAKIKKANQSFVYTTERQEQKEREQDRQVDTVVGINSCFEKKEIKPKSFMNFTEYLTEVMMKQAEPGGGNFNNILVDQFLDNTQPKIAFFDNEKYYILNKEYQLTQYWGPNEENSKIKIVDLGSEPYCDDVTKILVFLLVGRPLTIYQALVIHNEFPHQVSKILGCAKGLGVAVETTCKHLITLGKGQEKPKNNKEFVKYFYSIDIPKVPQAYEEYNKCMTKFSNKMNSESLRSFYPLS